ncbi:MAG: bifunctional UDP-N-acetylmuramoyl-tripeptide:D-alanyl-D-alanine ligase/alanine racemase [Chitinophagales bacterium]|nr:bifunctional UDP-N-acetylmuramoyl-tripeptide:D-alanyl-D-alanine ligase/alanine racemase [Chitinophagales bacterium]MCZ2392510.1 bifunctional UDP-N-acetylmuramoyl-tripeptide:D-alanyl-D-alanine ligase/alanine racemase [Chitinophagales bacterium]
MREYFIEEIAQAIQGKIVGKSFSHSINLIAIDSRRLLNPAKTLFIALAGKNKDGHQYISDAYIKGVRVFIVEHIDPDLFQDAVFILVKNPLIALQRFAIHHRSQFNIPVIGITGSNGKTIVKEWLYQLLSPEFDVCRSPKSYNSQLGVPLSVIQMEKHHSLSIFEAGISTIHEMGNLAKIIQPTIGIFTNIGPAHDAGFKNQEEKISEKIQLFKDCQLLIYCSDHHAIGNEISKEIKTATWGWSKDSKYQIVSQTLHHNITNIEIQSPDKYYQFNIPFSEKAYIENCLHCIILMIELNISPLLIEARIAQLRILPMRMELKYGINDCVVIDDSYSADLLSLETALEFYNQQEGKKKRTLIISSFVQSGMTDIQLLEKLIEIIRQQKFQKIIFVGELFLQYYNKLSSLKAEIHCFTTTEDLLSQIDGIHFDRELILIKGARQFQFERVSYQLLGQSHRTVFEIDLNALSENFDIFKSFLKKETGIIPMVKAFSYGIGSVEVATILEEKGVDYLAVAYVDEGRQLREGGISTRIIVMNPSIQDFSKMVEFQLEPEIYHISILESLIFYLETNGYNSYFPIHLKIESGMNRLGFQSFAINNLIQTLLNQDVVKVATIFSHLAASDEPEMDDFTHEQLSRFEEISKKIISSLDYSIKRHILNSSGIIRFTDYQYDYVRLGIGLYGVDSSHSIQSKLTTIGTLKTTISQIKDIPIGETIGYGRKGHKDHPIKIAVIAIGYADGYDRRFSNGIGEVFIKGQRAKIIGNICMDMCMADVTHIANIKEGDEVEIYGKNISIIESAEKIGTIPYELLTKISRRVRRMYFWN